MVVAASSESINHSLRSSAHSSRSPLLIWMLYGILLICCVGAPAVRRTQEARVLESAREMLDAGVHGWLIPMLNGQVRLQKPPLANWLAASGFELFGVSEQSGRLYAAITAWLTVAMTAVIAARLFDRFTAVLSGGLLGGSYLFCRFTLLAETDGLANLWMMAAIYCILRGREGPRGAMWFHLSAGAIGVATMAKASGAFALLFLIGITFLDRDWRLLWRWVKCGAPLTLAVIAAPWWLYALHSPEGKIISKELDDVTSGEDHGKPLWVYLPQLFRDVAPWTILLPTSVLMAIARARLEKQLLVIFVWFGAVSLPLCFIGNRQDHYLLPLMPPLMVIIAWSFQRAMSTADRWTTVQRAACIITFIATAVACVGMLVIPQVAHRRLLAVDLTLAGTLMIACAVIFSVWRARAWGAVVLWGAGVWMIVMPLMLTLWVPTFYHSNVRSIAASLQSHFGDRPYVFHSDIVYLPLIFELRRPIEAIAEDSLVMNRVRRLPQTVILSRIDPDPLLNDSAVHHVMSLGEKDQHFDVFTATP